MSEPIRFYRATGKHDFLSNLYRRPIRVTNGRDDDAIPPEGSAAGTLVDIQDGVEPRWLFTTPEHAYQFPKPKDPAVALWLMLAPSPHLVAVAAHALPGWAIRTDWRTYKLTRMTEVLQAKFTQHADLRARLLATGDTELIEASTTDAFWGIGASGKGQNQLGRMLMGLREALRSLPLA